MAIDPVCFFSFEVLCATVESRGLLRENSGLFLKNQRNTSKLNLLEIQ